MEKYCFLKWLRCAKKNFMFFKKKSIFGRFCDFGKITKTTKNHFFLLKGGNFFWHTLIIWENSIFSLSILFDSIKKKQKSHFFHFFWPKIAPPSTLRAKKSVKYKFSWKVYKIVIVTFDLNKIWYFIKYWPYMSIWGTFWPLKAKKWGKMGQNRCARSDSNHVWLILMKSVINGKVLFSQMIKVCQKKFSCFLRKNRFLAVFVILEKSQKRPKIVFFFWKVEIFLAHLNHLRKHSFFI